MEPSRHSAGGAIARQAAVRVIAKLFATEIEVAPVFRRATLAQLLGVSLADRGRGEAPPAVVAMQHRPHSQTGFMALRLVYQND
jgi:hypothetical protein